MSKLNVIKVEWINDEEVHIYPPGCRTAWWARPVKKLFGDGEVVWELHDDDETRDGAWGYLETPEDVFEAVAGEFDNIPVVVTKERD